jgi:extracellular factor (EF) 3-hydroxypalmitic acid methyl ester biosynthesis protein
MNAKDEVLKQTEAIHDFLQQLEREIGDSSKEEPPAFPRDVALRKKMQAEQSAAVKRHLPAVTKYLDERYAAIHALTANASDEQRQELVQLHRERIQPFFFQCPFVRRASEKPLGYPGDYLTVEMIFTGHDDGVTTMARLLSNYTLDCGPARAHRDRVPWVLAHLRLRARLHPGRAPRILSFACGPEHSLRAFAAFGARFEATLCDFDPFALEYTRRQMDAICRYVDLPPAIHYELLSTYQLIRDRGSLERLRAVGRGGLYDVIVVAGLLDYLKANVADKLMGLLLQLLVPGGLFLVTNVHAENPWRFFMESIGDWFVIHRTREELRELAVGTGEPRLAVTDVDTDRSGTNLFLSGRR